MFQGLVFINSLWILDAPDNAFLPVRVVRDINSPLHRVAQPDLPDFTEISIDPPEFVETGVGVQVVAELLTCVLALVVPLVDEAVIVTPECLAEIRGLSVKRRTVHREMGVNWHGFVFSY